LLATILARFTSNTIRTGVHLSPKNLAGLSGEFKIFFPSIRKIQIVFVAANYRAHKYSFKTSSQNTSLNRCKCLTLMKTEEFIISPLSEGSEQNPFIIKTEEA
jgi:hypothetical protein